jgi:hypothetical protein
MTAKAEAEAAVDGAAAETETVAETEAGAEAVAGACIAVRSAASAVKRLT